MTKATFLLRKALWLIFLTHGSIAIAQTAPGDVSSNLQLWMKANAGTSTTTNGQRVNNWTDSSPNGFTATKESTDGPVYRTNSINFNPALEFRGSHYFNLGKPAALNFTPTPVASNKSDMSIFAVFLTDQSGAGTLISRGGNSDGRSYQLWLGNTDRVVHYTLGRASGVGANDDNSGINYGEVHARNEPKLSSATIDINANLANDPNISKILRYVNGYLDPLTSRSDGDNGFGTGENTVADVLIGARRDTGNTGSGNVVIGDVAEIIIYDKKLSALERQKVETYLAIKYGITLGYNDEFYRTDSTPTEVTFGYGGTSNNYIASDGTYLWTGSQNTGFGFNVFGIARDDKSNLLQLKSKSVHVEELTGNTSILTIEDESNSIPNDKSYLLIGSNGATVALQSTSIPERTTTTLNRIWRARESMNNVGTVKLEFDLTQYPAVYGASPSDLMLLVSKNADLTNYKNHQGTYDVTTKTITFTGIDLNNAEYFSLGKLEEIQNSYHFSFNGSSRYIDLEDNNDLNGNFTISTWIKSRANSRAIVSKGGVNGYEFKLNSSGRLVIRWTNSGLKTLTSNNSVPSNIWHHVAAIYDGSTVKLYIDGIEEGSENASVPPATNSDSFLIGATGTTLLNNFFLGEMDELRVWKRALTVDQLHYIMNQEIEESTSGNIDGKIIPNTIPKNEVSAIPWADLIAYYPYSHILGNCLFNEASYTTNNGRLYNTPTSSFENQTAPLPFISAASTSWDSGSTWLNRSVQYAPGTTINGTKVDWNIAVISHNITASRDVSLLGLISNGNTLTINGNNGSQTGYGLTVSHYLKLNGSIDLQGESQLIQTENSLLEPTSSGSLEKDQQGTADTFTYNYWSSPVGKSNSSTNNNSYKVTDVFTNVSFLNSGYNGTSSPVGIADYWIWKFSNKLSNSYASWQHVRRSGTLVVGEGFTMKGPGNGAISDEQNYIFNGKPNNGDINLAISAGNDYLVGNPYPSAIDAVQFILDNGATIADAGSTNGTLYFWEHWGGDSHVLGEYQGGYATFSLAGGIPAAAKGTTDPNVATGGSATKIPGQYIPVGQGFFVTAETSGTIKFNNAQRIFQKEGSSNSVFVKNSNSKNSASKNTSEKTDSRPKIRLGFNSINTLHRQILITVDKNTTTGVDWGYDSKYIDTQVDDMYWMINDEKYTIQAIDTITNETIVPLGIHTKKDGFNNITIDKLENVPSDKPIFLHDKELNIYHDLKQGKYEIHLAKGEHMDRFEITFSQSQTTLSTDENENKDFETFYSNKKGSIIINNPDSRRIESIEMFNILGQSLFKLPTNANDSHLEYKIPNNISGNYIIKLETEFGIISKKVLIK